MSNQVEDLVTGFGHCFGERYTREETIEYMKKMYDLPEEITGKRFDSMMERVKDTDYLEQAAKRAVERAKRRRKNEKNKIKTDKINDRLQILSANTLQLVKTLTRKEKQILGFFVTKDFSLETSYTVEDEIHELNIDCHCFSCYYQHSISLLSLENHQVIEKILEEHKVENSVA